MSAVAVQPRLSQMQRIAFLVDQISYRPGTKFRILPTVQPSGSPSKRCVLYVTAKMSNLDGSGQFVDITRPIELDPDLIESMADEDFYRMVFREVVALETHEAEEWFKVNGLNLVDPHPELKQGTR